MSGVVSVVPSVILFRFIYIPWNGWQKYFPCDKSPQK